VAVSRSVGGRVGAGAPLHALGPGLPALGNARGVRQVGASEEGGCGNL
jgi:hypothetical protein